LLLAAAAAAVVVTYKFSHFHCSVVEGFVFVDMPLYHWLISDDISRNHGDLETSGTNFQVTWHCLPEEWSPLWKYIFNEAIFFFTSFCYGN
jgi:hypothetical protein